MRARLIMVIMLALALTGAAHAGVVVRVESGEVAVNTPFVIQVEIEGKNYENPAFPETDGLVIEKAPSHTQTSTQMQFVNNQLRSSSKRILGYSAHTTKTGDIMIPALVMKVDGKEEQSQPVRLASVPAGAIQQQRPPAGLTPGMQLQQQAPPQPQASQRPSRPNPQRELNWEEVLFTESTVAKKEVFQGEPVELKLSLWRVEADGVESGSFRGAEFRYPTTEGFYASNLEPKTERGERNGWNYEIQQYRQLLYPTRTGELTIGGWHWEGLAQAWTRMGLQRHNYALDTPAITVNVKELPQPRPPEFTGAVGSFTLNAKIGRTDVVQGVPVTLEVVVAGSGNPDAIPDPPMPKMESLYFSDPEKNTQVTDTPTGAHVEKTFKYSVTPLAAGDATIPEITFCYFNTTTSIYETAKSPAITLKVRASGEQSQKVVFSENLDTQRNRVDVLSEDIQPIIQEAEKSLAPVRGNLPGVLTALLLPPLLCGLFAAYMRYRQRLSQDAGFARLHFARSRFRKRLQAVERSAEPADELYRAVIGFVTDQFQVAEASTTSHDTARVLRDHNAPEDLTDQIVQMLRTCERARYASATIPSDELRTMMEESAVCMDRLETWVRKERRK